MIYDRTQNDVDTAISLRNTKVKAFQELTESEIATLEKGMLTINTLNRIENKQAELRGLLVSLGYSFFSIDTKTWTPADVFNEEEFARVVNNLDKLKNAFVVAPTTPLTPSPQYSFQTFNDIERILFDIDTLVENVASTINFGWAIGEAHSGIYFAI